MTSVAQLLLGLGLGLAVGVLSGLLGIGGGIVMVPALVYFWKEDMQTAVGTSLAAIIPVTIFGSLRHHFSYGNVDWTLAALLGISAILGTVFIGAPLCDCLPSDTLKKIFAVVMVVVGLHMLGTFQWIAGLVSR